MTSSKSEDVSLGTAIFNLAENDHPELWISSAFGGVIYIVTLLGDDAVIAHAGDGRRFDLGVQAWPVVKALRAAEVVPVVRKDGEGRPVDRYEARREMVGA